MLYLTNFVLFINLLKNNIKPNKLKYIIGALTYNLIYKISLFKNLMIKQVIISIKTKIIYFQNLLLFLIYYHVKLIYKFNIIKCMC